MFLELWDHRPIRHLGIHTGRVRQEDGFRQTELFEEVDFEKLKKMDKTVDTLRKRYGMDSVMRAAFLKQPIDHMSGGIQAQRICAEKNGR